MTRLVCLDELTQRLTHYTPDKLEIALPQAAVLLALSDNSGSMEIIFTQRANHLNSHAGQVAFPGGKKDLEDASLFETALRETEEEIALPRESIRLVGQLSQVISRQGILVSPFIGLVEGQHQLVPNEDELDSIFHVPVEYFLTNKPDCFDRIQVPKGEVYIPCYFYDAYEIWGLSAMILSEFLQVGFSAGFDLYTKPMNSDIRYR